MGEPAGRKKGGKKCKKGKKCKGKGKGKGKKCPSVDEVEAWFMEEHQAELCVFSELGWLDNSGNWSEAAAQADLATLSPNVTAVLSEDNIQQCMGMVMEEMAEDKIVKKCVVNGKGNYSRRRWPSWRSWPPPPPGSSASCTCSRTAARSSWAGRSTRLSTPPWFPWLDKHILSLMCLSVNKQQA